MDIADIAAGFTLPYIAIIPLLGAIAAYFVGKDHKESAGPIATVAAAVSFLLTVVTFQYLPPQGFETRLFQWISAGGIEIDFTLRFDQLSAVMCLIITGIGSLIHLYSVGYMHGDEGQHRFFSYLNLFLFSMLMLVLGGNLLVLFVGWEGVGLCSYLLIGFWFKNEKYAQAGMKAFVMNRIGDAGFLLGIFLLIVHFGTLDFVALQAMIARTPEVGAIATLVAFALFVGAAGKSAQIPLFTWLPDAMAGPTPVSALIHAATMVTAGIYLMARMHFLFEVAPLALAVVGVIAALTAFIAATIAITQYDIKKVLAYSTVSQLGFMFLATSVGAYWIALFHVVTHAFFKACLFLGAGSVIHGCHHEQDMRKMGGLFTSMPITGITYAISVLAIAGIFPFAGYQSKHAILHALEHGHYSTEGLMTLKLLTSFIPLIASVTAALTAFYMARSFAMVFLGKYRGEGHPHESPLVMTAPLIVLSGLATVGGLFLAMTLPEYLAPVLPDARGAGETITSAFSHAPEHLLSSWVGIAGVLFGILCYVGPLKAVPAWTTKTFSSLTQLSRGKYYFDEIYNVLVVLPLAWCSRVVCSFIDNDVVDGAVRTTGALVEFGGESLRLVQSGQTRHYALFMFMGATVILFLYLSF